jgi:predicted DsbA family dithiol-disulfide isomerase
VSRKERRFIVVIAILFNCPECFAVRSKMRKRERRSREKRVRVSKKKNMNKSRKIKKKKEEKKRIDEVRLERLTKEQKKGNYEEQLELLRYAIDTLKNRKYDSV